MIVRFEVGNRKNLVVKGITRIITCINLRFPHFSLTRLYQDRRDKLDIILSACQITEILVQD